MSKWADDFIGQYENIGRLKKCTKSKKSNDKFTKEMKLASNNITKILTGKKRRIRKWEKY